MVDWNRGYSAKYYISVVDKKTRRDLRRIEITGGSIKRSTDSLRESADITCINYSESGEQLIRVWLDVTQEGDNSHIPLFTGLATSPGKDINGRLVTNQLECYSVLKVAQDILLDRGWYAPAGANAGSLIRSLLSVTGSDIDISPEIGTISNAVIAESGENNLSMVDKILYAIGWRMTIDGYGNIHVLPQPKASDISTRFDSIGYDSLEPEIRIEYDWYACPNVCRAVLDDSYAIARDDSPDSPLSTVNRGREVWVEDSSGYLNENETLAEYAVRMLKEYQQVATTISYDRRYNPDVMVTDLIGLNYPAQGISGIFKVKSQSITLGYNAKTSEEVIQYG